MAARGLKLLFDEHFSQRQVAFVASESRLAEFQHVLGRGWSGLEDRDWIPRAVRAGFCIVTGDRNDRTRGYTVADLRAMAARVILVGGFFDHLSRWERAKWLVNRAESIVALADGLAPGTVHMVDRFGRGRAV